MTHKRGRILLKELRAEYPKKSRGVLTATCEIEQKLIPEVIEKDFDIDLVATIKDSTESVTCIVYAKFVVGPLARRQ